MIFAFRGIPFVIDSFIQSSGRSPLTEAALKIGRQNPSPMSTHPFTILSRHTISSLNDGTKLQNRIIQTDS
jgi:hypothetical protein